MKRISVFLTEGQIAALQQGAHETGLKFAELVRRAIDQYLAALDVRKEPGNILPKKGSSTTH
jgi:hypothetical protein